MYDRTESFDSSARIEENVSKFLTYDEQTKFREIKDLNGILQKKSPKLMVGWQKRYFEFKIKKGFYLAYYDKRKEELKGMLDLRHIKSVTKKSKKEFLIDYQGERIFELWSDSE